MWSRTYRIFMQYWSWPQMNLVWIEVTARPCVNFFRVSGSLMTVCCVMGLRVEGTRKVNLQVAGTKRFSEESESYASNFISMYNYSRTITSDRYQCADALRTMTRIYQSSFEFTYRNLRTSRMVTNSSISCRHPLNQKLSENYTAVLPYGKDI